jgi:hypothetical protein
MFFGDEAGIEGKFCDGVYLRLGGRLLQEKNHELWERGRGQVSGRVVSNGMVGTGLNNDFLVFSMYIGCLTKFDR